MTKSRLNAVGKPKPAIVSSIILLCWQSRISGKEQNAMACNPRCKPSRHADDYRRKVTEPVTSRHNTTANAKAFVIDQIESLEYCISMSRWSAAEMRTAMGSNTAFISRSFAGTYSSAHLHSHGSRKR